MKYFTINELTKSTTATRLGINNTPTKEITKCLTDLVDKVLDPIRAKWGSPIIVTSGYRCAKLNTAVGGAVNSLHRKGLAADIRTVSDTLEDNMKLFKLIRSLNLSFDLLIYEYGNDKGPDWIHISYGPLNRRLVLKAIKKSGKTVYNIMK